MTVILTRAVVFIKHTLRGGGGGIKAEKVIKARTWGVNGREAS